jgi:hypothetical protein
MVGNPLLGEAVELVELGLGVGLRGGAHLNPVDQELLDLSGGKASLGTKLVLEGSIIASTRKRNDTAAIEASRPSHSN